MEPQELVPAADPPRPPTDNTLLRRLRGGNEDAATQLYLRYAQRLLALIRSRASPQMQRRVEPEDLVQSVFRRFFRRVRQGDYDVPAGEELWGLFLVIALNRIRAEEKFQRADKRDVRRQSGDAEAVTRQAADGRDETAFAVLQLTIQEALDQLPAPKREMLELRIQGHEVAEIAARTGRSKRTVERILQEVRARLRAFLESPPADESLANAPPEPGSDAG